MIVNDFSRPQGAGHGRISPALYPGRVFSKEEEAEVKETEMSLPSAETQARCWVQNLRTDFVLSGKKLLAAAAAASLASDTETPLLPLASAEFLSLCWVRGGGVALFSVAASEGAGAAGC